MILRYADSIQNIHIDKIDIATRWRAIHDLARWKRIVGGGIQLCRDVFLLLWQLIFYRPQVIHLTTSGQFGITRDLAMIRLANVFGVPTVYHIRFGRIPDIAQRNTAEWHRISRAMRLVSTVVAIDLATRHAIERYLPNANVVRIPNCIDPDELPPYDTPSSPSKTLVYIGHVIPAKGIEELLEAWAGLGPTDWRLQIIGPCSSAFRESLLRFPQDRIVFEGEYSHENAMVELAQADALVLPSYTEGFPNVVLEAMALRKPVVATKVGAIPEMLADFSDLLVEPHDSRQLQDAIRNLMNNPEKYAASAEQAYRKAENEYFIDPVFRTLRAVWENAANHKHVSTN
tara:strand:- start:3024 stop:4055 length:1032 start_codon:yes stop_codon:yes gene_type:complete